MRLAEAAAKVVAVPMAVAVDVETSGLHWWRDKLGVISFSWGDEPDESYATRNIAVGVSMVQERMNNGLPVVFHNASFDLHFLKKAGLRPVWATVQDTLLMARLKNNLGQSDLKSMGKSMFGIEPDQQKDLKSWLRKNKGSNYLDVPDEILMPYAREDTRLTWMLYYALKGDVNKELYKRELRLRELMFDVEEYGVEVDVKAIEYRLDWALEEQEKLEQRLYRLHGSDINLDSNPQLVQWLYEDIGLTPATFTPTGQPQVNAYNLAANPHPVTRLLRARNKRVDTVKFFNAYLQLRDEDNRLHPTINTMQARTHRFSCQDPNAQQIPARGDRFTTREVFVSGDGWFAGADYDKQELRLAAEYAGDGALLAALTSGEDIYVSMASAMLRKPANQISGGERQAAKIAVLSMIYGAGAPKVAESFTLNTGRLFTVEEAKLIRDNFKAAYPGLAWLMADCQKRARNDGYVENAWGRRLYVERERAYVATDYLVQSSGRDVLTDAILNTAEYLKPYGGRLLIPIHDELFCYVPEEPSDAFLAGLGEAMTNYKFSLPMTVTPKKGVTFAGLK